MVETDESDQHLWQIYCLISLTVTSFFLHINALSSSFDDHQVRSGNNCHIIRIFYTEDLAGYLSFISKPKDMNLLSALMKSTYFNFKKLPSFRSLENILLYSFCDFTVIIKFGQSDSHDIMMSCFFQTIWWQYDDKISVRW